MYLHFAICELWLNFLKTISHLVQAYIFFLKVKIGAANYHFDFFFRFLICHSKNLPNESVKFDKDGFENC